MTDVESPTASQARVPPGTAAETTWRTDIGGPVEPVYEPQAGERSAGYDTHIGNPGSYPFTRHIYASAYRDRAWAPSLYSGFGTPSEANQRFRHLIAQGNGRANVATDLPTQIGLDSDDPLAVGEVGRVGVAIDSLEDFETMFAGVPLDRTPVSFNVNTVAPIFVAMLVATARKQGVEPAALTGTIANDLLHEYVARGTWRYPPAAALRLSTDIAEYTTAAMPKFFPFNIRSILLHESGAHPGQEIGLTFAIATRYVDEILKRDIPIDVFAPRLSFFFGMGLHFLQEAAKFRAARRMWAQLMRDVYGAQKPNSQRLRITSVAPCGSHFTAVEPELNLVRGTLGVLAGALGGVQALLGTTIDEAFDIPTERNAEWALRTQQIVALESDVCATADPLGGSYFVEAMTDQIEASARVEMDHVGHSAGIVDAILAGRPQADLAARAYELATDLESGRTKQVGVNIHRPSAPAPEIELHDADPALHAERARSLERLRLRRDSRAVEETLSRLGEAARSKQNVMEPLIAAVEAYVTVGEISRLFDDAFGAYQQPVIL